MSSSGTLVVYPPSENIVVNSAAVSIPSISVSTETPFHTVSSFDHLVTQWMSLVTVSEGNAGNSFQVHRFGSSISPWIVNVHWSRFTRGVGPAESTGKSVTTYCPGRSEGHTSELQSRQYLVCRLLLEKKNKKQVTKKYIT